MESHPIEGLKRIVGEATSSIHLAVGCAQFGEIMDVLKPVRTSVGITLIVAAYPDIMEDAAKARRELGPHVSAYALVGPTDSGIMHWKCCVVDGSSSWLGSYDLTGNAKNLNEEMAVVFKSESVGKALVGRVETMAKSEYAVEL